LTSTICAILKSHAGRMFEPAMPINHDSVAVYQYSSDTV